MGALRDLYLDHAGSIFLGAFVIVTVALAVAAWRRLPGGWWIGASIAAAVMVGLTTMIALALRGLTPDGAVPPEGWFAVAFAGLLGFVAATDVQLAWGLLREDRSGRLVVGVSAVLGPIIIACGYLLLTRSVEWVRFGLG